MLLDLLKLLILGIEEVKFYVTLNDRANQHVEMTIIHDKLMDEKVNGSQRIIENSLTSMMIHSKFGIFFNILI